MASEIIVMVMDYINIHKSKPISNYVPSKPKVYILIEYFYFYANYAAVALAVE